jgi:NAD(P)H-hydrate epimerase
MIPVVTAAEMRELDRLTIEEIGLPALLLMENAGRAVAREARRVLRQRGARRGEGRVVVVAGAGNNGGDGLVAARALHGRGTRVEVLLAADPAALRGDAKHNLDVANRMGIDIRPLTVRPGLGGPVERIDALTWSWTLFSAPVCNAMSRGLLRTWWVA